MRKLTSRLVTVMWALTLAAVIKHVAIYHSLNHITIDFTHPTGLIGWLFTISLLLTAFDYIYFHLIKAPKK
ncbi:hypothetical protein [Companilactobacillus mindensis]|jgi:hypothetical protein|nr:hypothetical protein [Companilactobacillus mindensis]GEO79501.1 hypothetical protein LMI01_18320 [Companilactobacillus mindensis]